jgi:CubicO group peptidase (beta-lactamase class C family)
MPGYWVYSDVGFVTLGWAIVGASMMSYPILLQDVITRPVGLPSTWGVVPSTVPADLIAVGYTGPKEDPHSESAAKGTDIKSTARDMLTWVTKNLSLVGGGGSGALDQAISLALSTQIKSPEYPDNEPTPFSMGLAWQISAPGDEHPDISIIAKDGGVSRGRLLILARDRPARS